IPPGAGEGLCRMARDHGGRVRPRDQGMQSEKRRCSAESGGVHRGGASGHGRYGQKHPGREAAVANEPGSFRLSGQLETLGILFYASYHTDQSVRSNFKSRNYKSKKRQTKERLTNAYESNRHQHETTEG